MRYACPYDRKSAISTTIRNNACSPPLIQNIHFWTLAGEFSAAEQRSTTRLGENLGTPSVSLGKVARSLLLAGCACARHHFGGVFALTQ